MRPMGAELEQELIQLRGSSCDKHKDKQVKLYCYDCNDNICLMCFAVKHRQHETAKIPEAAKSFSQNMKYDTQQVLSLISNVKEKTQEKDKKRSEFLRQLDKVKSEIVTAGERVNEVVNNQVAAQLDEVEMTKAEDAKKAQTVDEHYQLALLAMESFHAYSRELMDKGRPSDITRAASELHKRATELLDSDVTSIQYCPPHVTFTPADVTQVKQLNLIGKVSVAADKQRGKIIFAYMFVLIYIICCCDIIYSFFIWIYIIMPMVYILTNNLVNS